MKLASATVDQTQVFVIINKDGKMINSHENANNQSRKEYLKKDFFRILVFRNVEINHVMLEIIVNVEKNQLIN